MRSDCGSEKVSLSGVEGVNKCGSEIVSKGENTLTIEDFCLSGPVWDWNAFYCSWESSSLSLKHSLFDHCSILPSTVLPTVFLQTVFLPTIVLPTFFLPTAVGRAITIIHYTEMRMPRLNLEPCFFIKSLFCENVSKRWTMLAGRTSENIKKAS